MTEALSSASPTLDALVLAGRRTAERDPLAGLEGAPHKALLIAGGKPLIRRVVEALQDSRSIAAIRIAAPDDVRAPIADALAGLADWSFAAPLDSPAATVLQAIEALPAERALLVTTCDHALLTGAIVRRFLAEARGGDVAAACVSRDVYEARFSQSRRTFIRLKDLPFSGANLFWFAGARARRLADFWRKLEAKRKDPAAMARAVGLLPALAYATGRLTRAGLERTISRKAGVAARLVPLPYAEAAIDVDKPEDLALVRSILALDPSPTDARDD
jgi:molybdopterin-guanine dinucleotide biosynthesis protein A